MNPLKANESKKTNKTLVILAIALVATILLTLPVSPASATKGSFPGINGKIVFYAEDPGPETDEEIFIMNSDGTCQTQLTFNDVVDEDPVWSPNGKEIAFSREVAEGDTRILVMNPCGEILRELTSGFEDDDAAWSPDGSMIAFAREIGLGDEDLYVVPADGSADPFLLYSSDGVDESPSWSPKGTHIVFTSDQDGEYELYLMKLCVPSCIIQLTHNEVVDDDPCWSPDGTKIVFYSTRTGNGDLYVLSVCNPCVQTLLYGDPDALDEEPNWSPDGKKIAFAKLEASIWVVDANGCNPHEMTPDLPDADDPDYQTLRPRMIFCDGFESGSFCRWSGTRVTYGETVRVTSYVAKYGCYSGKFTSSGGGGYEWACILKNIPCQTDLCVGGYFKVTGSGIRENGDYLYLIALKAGDKSVAYVGWKKTAVCVKWCLTIRNGDIWTTAYSISSPSLSRWYSVQLRWVESATCGFAELWVDDALVCTIKCKNTAAYGDVNSVNIGLALLRNCGCTTVYVDQCTIKSFN